MADINKCDIEGETRTGYRLKEGVPIAIFDMDSYFEPVELPVVELKEDILKVGDYNVTVTKEYYGRYWSIYLRQSKEDIMYQVCLGEMCILKSIEDFNNRAAMLFGFYLKEPEGAEK